MIPTSLKVSRRQTEFTGFSSLYPAFMLRWIQAKCAVERCKEELVIVPVEMERFILGCGHRARLWTIRANKPCLSAGHRAYALRKADVWQKLADKAERAFTAVLGRRVLLTHQNVHNI